MYAKIINDIISNIRGEYELPASALKYMYIWYLNCSVCPDI